MHVHLDFEEKITPLRNDIIFYVYGGDAKCRKFILKVGHTYTVPKGVKHAVIFSKENIIKLIWK
jgi:cupin superfamily acireductone dioxygenase involved in methionine salvage